MPPTTGRLAGQTSTRRTQLTNQSPLHDRPTAAAMPPQSVTAPLTRSQHSGKAPQRRPFRFLHRVGEGKPPTACCTALFPAQSEKWQPKSLCSLPSIPPPEATCPKRKIKQAPHSVSNNYRQNKPPRTAALLSACHTTFSKRIEKGCRGRNFHGGAQAGRRGKNLPRRGRNLPRRGNFLPRHPFFPGPHPAFTARRPAENRCYVKKFTYDVIFFTYDVIFFT